jgi:DNA-binding CsgD family transcriptional regulator
MPVAVRCLQGMGATVIGREEELGAVGELLDALEGGPAALLLEGEAGIGKTTVWDAAVEAARRAGLRVLVCRGVGSEVRLGYAALTDLLAEVDDEAVAVLPAPQRRALEAALLRAGPAEGPPPDPRAVATGLLTLLEHLAGAGPPVLLAIDELQWLDRSSAVAVRFAVRRLRGPVGLLAARRNPPEPQASDDLRLRKAEGLRVARVGPLGREQIHRLVRERTGFAFPPPALRRIDRVAAGNPFVALEIARALGADRRDGRAAFPESLRELIAARLAGLEPDVLEALLLAAALARPRVGAIQRALPGTDAAELLGRAEAAEIVVVTGAEVAFTHPVLASGVYAAANGPKRREAHRRLAAVVEGTEERARHLALAATDAAPEVIGALDEAAQEARARGAPADAAELLELALGLGAVEPARRVAAAEGHFAAGDLRKAEELAREALSELEPGPGRARALGLLGAIRHRDYSYAESAALLEQAIAEAGPGAARVTLAIPLVYVLTNSQRLRDAVDRASAAVAEAEGLGDDGLLAEALAVRTMIGFLVGRGIDEGALARSLELEDPQRSTPILLTPSAVAGRIWGWTGRFEDSRVLLERARRRCLDRGAESDLLHMSTAMATTPCEAGELDRIRELVADAAERALQLGTPAAQAVALSVEATEAAWTGDEERGRRAAHEALALYESMGELGEAFWPMLALSRLELSLGLYEPVVGMLVPALDALFAMGWGEPATPPFLPDAIEALLALGRVEEARRWVRWLGERADALDRPQVLAWAARCRGLLAAAEGDLDFAEEALAEALVAHGRDAIPYDRARTLLVAGQLGRRRRRWRAARDSLEEARDTFDSLGASLWAGRCESELGRLGRRRSRDGDRLTPSEWRVAELAARGLKNREVAAELFMSPKTVEANLTRVYRKLGIHSRAELGRWLAGARTDSDRAAVDP